MDKKNTNKTALKEYVTHSSKRKKKKKRICHPKVRKWNNKLWEPLTCIFIFLGLEERSWISKITFFKGEFHINFMKMKYQQMETKLHISSQKQSDSLKKLNVLVKLFNASSFC